MLPKETTELLKTTITESNCIEFKSEFNYHNNGEVIEIIKDIIAISNSGGGGIAFGIYDDGTFSSNDCTELLRIDLADFSNKIRKYINKEFDAISIETIKREGRDVVCFIIQGSNYPIIFENPGTYELPNTDRKQKTAFGKGTIYVRHGSKSETANNYDLIELTTREIDRIKDSWLGNIKRVVEAPIGHIIQVLPPNVIQRDSPDAKAIRFSDEPDAPVYRIDNPDKDCPYRTKDVIHILNGKLLGKYTVNQWDIHVIQEVYSINYTKPNYFFRSRFGPKQFSMEFIEWMYENYKNNNMFFINARQKMKRGV
jgi:hypothetical protein